MHNKKAECQYIVTITVPCDSNVRLIVETEITYNRRQAKQNDFTQIDNIDINNDRSLLCQHINIANHS